MVIAEIHDEEYFKKYGKPITFYIERWIKDRFDNKVIPDLQKRDKDCIIAFDGKEGCLFRDTLIKTDKGDVSIEDLNNGKQFNVYSMDTLNGETKKSKAICVPSGEQELFEIETEDGRKIKATKNHTFFIKRDNKVIEIELSKLKVGDELICH